MRTFSKIRVSGLDAQVTLRPDEAIEIDVARALTHRKQRPEVVRKAKKRHGHVVDPMGAPPPYPRPYPRIATRCSGRGPKGAPPPYPRPYPRIATRCSGRGPKGAPPRYPG